jgi:hypothetical protein
MQHSLGLYYTLLITGVSVPIHYTRLIYVEPAYITLNLQHLVQLLDEVLSTLLPTQMSNPLITRRSQGYRPLCTYKKKVIMKENDKSIEREK